MVIEGGGEVLVVIEGGGRCWWLLKEVEGVVLVVIEGGGRGGVGGY